MTQDEFKKMFVRECVKFQADLEAKQKTEQGKQSKD
jgi:hypothetical protein